MAETGGTTSTGPARASARVSLLLAVCGGAACGGAPGAEPVVSIAVAAPEPPRAEEGRPPPGEMVLVPAGPFVRGCVPADTGCYDNETPRRSVFLDAFSIDRVEVTVAAYRACVEAGACNAEKLTQNTPETTTALAAGDGENTTHFLPPVVSATCNWKGGRDDHPVNCVSWFQASAFCAWAGKRLPTEAEWEKAARGIDERIYPWGNSPPSCDVAVMQDRGRMGCDAGTTAPAGSRPHGASPYGALDMIGNVCEWVSDWYQQDVYASAPDADPVGPPSGDFRVIRGGSWQSRVGGGMNALRISNRYSYTPTVHLDYVGFRCAVTMGGAETPPKPPRPSL